MKRWFWLLAGMVMVVILLAGCKKDDGGGVVGGSANQPAYTVFYIKSMPCVWAEGLNRGGLSCDWSQWVGGQ